VGAQVGARAATARRSTATEPRRRSRARSLLIVGAAALFTGLAVAPAASAAPGDAPSISWDSTKALDIDATPGAGVPATLLNDTAAALAVTLQVDAPEAITVTPAQLDIPAGQSATVTVSVVNAPVAGSYTVTAVAGPAPGTVIRRSVIVGPTAAVPAATAAGGVSSWMPWESTLTADGPGIIPLTSPSSCADLAPVGSPLGYLHSDRGGIGTVSAACTEQDGHAALQLDYAGLGLTGATYAGDVTFGDAKVSLSVRRTAGYLLPVVALLAGFAVALWILGRTPSRVIKPLRQRILQLRAAIGTPAGPGSAVREYLDAAAGAPWGDAAFRDDAAFWDDAATQIGGIEADLTALGKAKRFSLTSDSAAVKDLEARITAAAGCTKDLPELGRILKRVQSALPVVESTNILPSWTANTRSSLLAKGPTTLAGIPAERALAGGAESICLGWSDIAVQVDALRRRAEELTANAQLPADDKHRVTVAYGKLLASLAAFGRAKTNDDVKAVLDGQYHEARQAIDELKALSAVPQPGGTADRMFLPAGADRGLIGQDLALPADYQAEITAIADKEQLASWITLAIVIVVLLVAGLQALVVGKAFGTPFDFLLAFTWGAGSALIAQLLAPAIEGLVRITPTPT